ncbi:zinc finger protein swm [Contarinia nasturtii]|uniref:zinc finger protein swm n=1 Tax=Contarinia nasturtii TaxID=265458 RepID=UPI0012D3A0B6|nr:zinc finger protein swm [Contarinia nasturtii]XP_031634193.1 zinc finger protein swm [Contarinia nasturtii]
MQINHPEELKAWLTVVLDPLCEADPAALARYVLALLKKEKPLRDLQQCMNEQLDVFLGVQTKPFLTRLFEMIATEEYLNETAIDRDIAIEASNSEQVQSSQETQSSSLVNESDLVAAGLDPARLQSVARNMKGTPRPVVPNDQNNANENDPDYINSSPLGSSITKLRDVSPISPVKHGNDNENHRKEQRRRSARSRSRSRSPRGSLRRGGEREKYGSRGHSYRNKSPANSNPFRRNSGHEPRSPKYYKRSDSPPAVDDEECKGARSLSPQPPKKNDRCRDFDEKGYCMRGETCPWDHGVNPVVLEDINNPTLMTIQAPHRSAEYNPDAPEIWAQGGSFLNGPNRTGPPNNAPLNSFQRMPTTAAYRVAPPFPFPPNAGTTPLQRELISVPVVEANSGGDISASQKRRYEPEDTVAVAEGPTKRKLPINSRLGPPNRVGLQNNCSLELRKVPRGLNSIAHLNNHFCKFGKIVNIQVSYEGDPEAAIVTFSTHAEANVAYRSTEAVLNNRFIKVFWHTPGTNAAGTVDGNHNATPNANSNVNASGNAKEDNTINSFGRKSNQYSLNNTVPANPTPASTEFTKSGGNVNAANNNASNASSNATFTKSTTAPTVIPPASALTTNRNRNSRITRTAPEAIRKKKEEQVKAAVQLAHGLHKRKHELLQGYLKQMRTCLELVEKMDSTDPQRTTLLTTVKSLQNNIDNLNKEIASDQAQITAQIQPAQHPVKAHPFIKSKELQKKELLDIELELIAQQQDGNDTTEIQKRLEELQKTLGTASKQIPFPPTRSLRVRPAPPGSTSFDRRPTTILVAGFSSDECDAVLGHFKHFGEITKNDIDKTTPYLKLTYATRLNAEQAMLRGRRFNDKQLQMSWFVQNAEPPKIATEEELLDDTVNDDNLTSEVRLEDEEDDEEAEDRSWRR